MSTTKTASILANVQANIEVTDDSDQTAFLTILIDGAARWLTEEIGHIRYPELSQGFSVSGAAASVDISSESTDRLLVSLDGDGFQDLVIVLANCTTGLLTAAEIQTQLRAVGTGVYKFATVTFDATDTTYTITSPTFGKHSMVNVSSDEDLEHVAVALKLSPEWGGTEYNGGTQLDSIDHMVELLVTSQFNQIGVEGMESFNVPGEGSYKVSDTPPSVLRYIHNHRKLC